MPQVKTEVVENSLLDFVQKNLPAKTTCHKHFVYQGEFGIPYYEYFLERKGGFAIQLVDSTYCNRHRIAEILKNKIKVFDLDWEGEILRLVQKFERKYPDHKEIELEVFRPEREILTLSERHG